MAKREESPSCCILAGKKLTTAKRVAEEMLHAWDLNIGRASWALPHILRIYDNTTLIEAHYWNRQNASDQATASDTHG